MNTTIIIHMLIVILSGIILGEIGKILIYNGPFITQKDSYSEIFKKFKTTPKESFTNNIILKIMGIIWMTTYIPIYDYVTMPLIIGILSWCLLCLSGSYNENLWIPQFIIATFFISFAPFYTAIVLISIYIISIFSIPFFGVITCFYAISPEMSYALVIFSFFFEGWIENTIGSKIQAHS